MSKVTLLFFETWPSWQRNGMSGCPRPAGAHLVDGARAVCRAIGDVRIIARVGVDSRTSDSVGEPQSRAGHRADPAGRQPSTP